MTQMSLRTLPVALMMTTALSWGLPLRAADLEADVKAKPTFSIGPAGASTQAGAKAQASAKEKDKEPKVAPATSQKGAQLDNKGRSADALSAITDGKAQDGKAAVGTAVRGAVATDGQAQAPGRTTSP